MTAPASTPSAIPSRDDIERAHEVIAPYVRRTPTLGVELAPGLDVLLKLELCQHTGSFKPRGAFHSVLTAPEPAATLVAASGGNHGLAVAYVAARLGLRARIFLPTTSPEVKVRRLRELGAETELAGSVYADALAASTEAAAEPGALRVHAYDGLPTVTGQGTVGRELAGQVDADTVLVAVGGGGLIGGVASWFGGGTRIVAVEPVTTSAMHAALDAGRPVDTEPTGYAVDALGASQVGEVGFAALRAAGARSVLVTDEDIRQARQHLWRIARIAAEPAGATAVAALLSGAYRPDPGERVAAVVCGGNASPADLA